MHRRTFFTACILAAAVPSVVAANHKFVFKIKTKSGGIIAGVLIEAKDAEAAKYKLRQRYPDCQILEMEEK